MYTPKQVMTILEGFELPKTLNAEEIEPVTDHPCPILRTSPYTERRDLFMVGVYETAAALAIFLKKKREDRNLHGLTLGSVASAGQLIEEGRMPLPWNRVSGGVVPDDAFSEGAVSMLGALVVSMVGDTDLTQDSVPQVRAKDTTRLQALAEQEAAEVGAPKSPAAAPKSASTKVGAPEPMDLFALAKLGWDVSINAGGVTMTLDMRTTIIAANAVLASLFPGKLIVQSEVDGQVRITVSM